MIIPKIFIRGWVKTYYYHGTGGITIHWVPKVPGFWLIDISYSIVYPPSSWATLMAPQEARLSEKSPPWTWDVPDKRVCCFKNMYMDMDIWFICWICLSIYWFIDLLIYFLGLCAIYVKYVRCVVYVIYVVYVVYVIWCISMVIIMLSNDTNDTEDIDGVQMYIYINNHI